MFTTAFHGTPITPEPVLRSLKGRNFCVSFFRPDQIAIIAEIAASFILDNGAFSAWKKGLDLSAEYWATYYVFVRYWIERGALYFIIPDVINAGSQLQDALLRECPPDLLPWAVPVWHMDEPISRLMWLLGHYPRVAIGSTAEFAVVGSPSWRGRMDDVWNTIAPVYPEPPETHMLRGLQCELPTFDYPFRCVDSTHLARNHNRLNIYGEDKLWAVGQFADRWDRLNCPDRWRPELRVRAGNLFEMVA